jgi:microcystin-dependent protein
MLTSTRRSIQYPNPTRADAPDIPAHFLNLINALDLDIPFYTGLDSAKPTPTYVGAIYWATDTALMYLWTGSWVAMASKNSPALTGSPTAPTPAVTDSSTAIATTAFVRNILPAGIIVDYGGAAAPSGWTLCDGSAINRTTFATLFAVIGTAFGAGDGSTTFNVPDLRGRVAVGKNAGTFNVLGGTGGVETHSITAAEMPGHTHTFTTGTESANHTHAGTTDSGGSHSHTIHTIESPGAINDYGFSNISGTSVNVVNTDAGGAHTHTFTSGTQSANHTHSGTTASTGSGTAMSLLQPYQVTNKIIKQ